MKINNKEINQIFSNLNFSNIFWKNLDNKFKKLKKSIINDIIKELSKILLLKKKKILEKEIEKEKNIYDTFLDKKILKKSLGFELSFLKEKKSKRKNQISNLSRNNSKKGNLKKQNIEIFNLLSFNLKRQKSHQKQKSHKKNKSIYLSKKKKNSLLTNINPQSNKSNVENNLKQLKKKTNHKKKNIESIYLKSRKNSLRKNSFNINNDIFVEKEQIQEDKSEEKFYLPQKLKKEKKIKNIPFLLFESNSKTKI